MYLNCHSYYSLRYGILSIQDLIGETLRCQVEALVLTEVNVIRGVFDFIKACNDAKLKLLVNIEFRNADQLLFIALAKNHQRLYEMNVHLSRYNISKKNTAKACSWF